MESLTPSTQRVLASSVAGVILLQIDPFGMMGIPGVVGTALTIGASVYLVDYIMMQM